MLFISIRRSPKAPIGKKRSPGIGGSYLCSQLFFGQDAHGMQVVNAHADGAADVRNGITQAQPFQSMMQGEDELHPSHTNGAHTEDVDGGGDRGALHTSQAAQKDLRDRIRDIAPAGNEQPDLAGGDHLRVGVIQGNGRAIEEGEEGYDEAKKALKESQKEFTKTLASYADYYINDAFGTAHRAHASTALIADYFDAEHKMYGCLMGKEVEAVDKVMKDIKRPFTAIMGGSKVSTKIEIIENLLNKVDNLILCGGMTYTFKKALGGNIGKSICENDKLDLALSLLQEAKDKGVNLVLAVDAVVADDFSNDANTLVVDPMDIPEAYEGMDIGPKTRELFGEVIKNSKTILWNGPCGVFEFDNFSNGSRAIAEAIVEATKNGAFSLIGGGDSVACVNKFNLADQVSYVSTGGGALLEAIEGKELPGIAAIK